MDVSVVERLPCMYGEHDFQLTAVGDTVDIAVARRRRAVVRNKALESVIVC